ncbi:MAG: stimulus-sensing domain-containing protein, partial [Vicinamibacteria bacterium]
MTLRGIHRILSKISIRLLAFNALLVFIPAMAVSYLEVYERKLLWAQERSMVQQGRALAAALSEQGPLSPSSARSILERLEQQTTSRVRVLDHEGSLLADTSRPGSTSAASVSSGFYEDVARDPRETGLYRVGAALFRVWEWISGAPGAPVSQEYYVADERFQGGEIQQALRGRYGAATRVTPGGQRSVTLYSALPIWDAGRVVGIVLVSQSTFLILQDLYEIRLFAFRFVLGAVAVAAFLTLLLSTTISRPLNRLRSQAVALVDRRGRLTAKFRATRRLDEIGDLSRALSELSEHLEERMRFVESLAADVAHEFRNPLTSIRAAAEM